MRLRVRVEIGLTCEESFAHGSELLAGVDMPPAVSNAWRLRPGVASSFQFIERGISEPVQWNLTSDSFGSCGYTAPPPNPDASVSIDRVVRLVVTGSDKSIGRPFHNGISLAQNFCSANSNGVFSTK